MALRRGASDKEDSEKTMKHGSPGKAAWKEWTARFARRAVAFAFALAASAAHAGPAAGTVIVNQATGTGTAAGSPVTAISNPVNAIVGTGVTPPGGFAATLVASQVIASLPGATVFARHTLTNTGTFADTYTLTTTQGVSSWNFASITLFADANQDGVPDSATPLTTVSLAPGASLFFVARYVLPATAGALTENTVRIDASGTGLGPAPANGVTNTDRITLGDPTIKPDCVAVSKQMSRSSGPSPAGPVTVTLSYTSCDKARAKLIITDRLPAGLKYVAGSGRWSGTGALGLTDAVVGQDRQGPGGEQVAYDFNVTAAGTVTATLFNVPVQDNGTITFDVQVDSGVAVGTTIVNGAAFTVYDANGNYTQSSQTNTASYLVTGKADFDLVGDHLPSVTPGTTVTFTNVLTNRGDTADTYDITLDNSTFPPGTTLALFKSDGVTPLADTDGDGVPDTGLVAPGASYRIIVRARTPETSPPGTYKVTKTARSAAMPIRSVSADDIVDALVQKCLVSLDPDNNAQVGFGQHVTYTHFLTNRGNCTETVRATVAYLADSRPGWVSKVFIDNKVAGGGSIPGALDATDTQVVSGWTATLAPGETLRVLVDVTAPLQDGTSNATTAAKSASGAKAAIGDTDVTTVVLTSTSSGALTVHDTTIVQEKAGPVDTQDVIRNYTDATFGAPTFFAVTGGNLYLKADAASCNAASDVVESRIVLITGPNGEQEQVTAVETGAATGVFTVPAMPVRPPPVKANDGILEGNPNDVFEISVQGCGRTISTVVTLIEPRSIVFDSQTNDPIAGATVALVGVSGGVCGTAPVSLTGVANPVVTGSDGRFAFPTLASGQYCLSVTPPNGYRFPSTVPWPQLPTGRNVLVSGLTAGGSYGGAFSLGPNGVLVVDIPLDTTSQSGLFVQKEASKATVEVGDFVDYTVRVRNGTGNSLTRADVTLTDNLPAGFGFVKGTARRDGNVIADPAGGAGPQVVFDIGTMARDAQAVLTYRVRTGPGSQQGDGVNRVQARYAAGGVETLSNVASARVKVTGGVFTEKGFILGKVFMDCNANGAQDKGELGVPGVRVVLEDGTYVLTDGGGKFSFYGISNRTHVVKADRTTLPAGSRLATTSFRNLGDPNSRIVDLKAGELARADFAIDGCAEPIVEAVKQRIEVAGKSDELSAMFGSQLATQATVVSDVRALPAAGVVAMTPTAGLAPAGGVSGAPGFTSAAPANGFTPTAPANGFPSATRPSPAPGIAVPAAAAPTQAMPPLEEIAVTLDNKLGFINLVDGQSVDYTQTTVRVKGAAGSAFSLSVNGAEVPAARVGKRSVLQEKQLQAWEYIGVPLVAGENTLTLAQVDQFGNARGSVSIKVLAPGELGRIVVEVPTNAVADGKTPVKIVVKVMDARGTPVTVRTPVTIGTDIGRWSTPDLDPNEPGLQVMVEGGRAEVELLPPLEPASTNIVVASGKVKAMAKLDFLPELRSLIANGVVEGIVNLRNVGHQAITPVRESDGFEQELSQLSRTWNDGKTQAGARAAFYLKGKIKGDYLLTAAYDSDKDTKERLFRDIQPDEFYPIYGDSGVRGFDAQSTSKLYVRVDNKRSYLLWGDFTTQVTSEARKLSNYSRSLTGVKEHYENGSVSVNAFASRDTTRQVIEELRANGTSGPYQMGTPGALVNSEKIELIVRDRNQPALIVSTTQEVRFADYEIEALTGRILFKAPVPSVDRDLNPVFVRLTYEVDQGGAQFWVAGVDAQVKLGDRVEVGGVYVRDQNPLAPFKLAGANATVKVAEGTYVIGEAARTENGIEEKKGDAGRIEVKHESTDLKANAYVAHTDKDYDNPGAYLSQGRGESGGKLEYKLTPRTTIRAEALRTEDLVTSSKRDGLAASIQYQLHERLTLELGVRHAAEKGLTSAVPSIQSPDGVAVPTAPLPDEVTTVRAKVTGSLPQVQGLTVYGEAEVDVHDADRRIIAAGAEYQMPNKGRIYARHEFVSSITGPYGLNAAERQNTTAVGVDTEYMKDGRLFSEYRIRDALSGGDAEAALGLKNLWSIAPGWKLGTTFERVKALSGTDLNENTALALALEYTGSPIWKGSTRLEVRDSHSTESLLFTVGLAARLSKDFTALARNAYTVTRNKDGGGEHTIERMQAGVAFRDNESNRWNALARVEERMEKNDQDAGIDLKSAATILSVHADWQPRRPFLVSGRYAAKWTTDDSNGLSTRYRAQVAGLRGTWEFARKWDVSLVGSVLFGQSTASRQYGAGIEVGYLLATNLWVSAGYNVSGYRDADLAGADYTARGPFVRLRYKFDESIMPGAGENNKEAAIDKPMQGETK